MYKIQVLNSISQPILKQFPSDMYEISPDVKEPDAILVRSHDMHAMDIPHSVKVIGRAGAGVNNIPVSMLTERGVPVMNTPGANANAVRELVLAGMLIASRNIYQAWRYLNDVPVNDLEKRIEQDKKKFIGTELQGKTLGVIGLGNIGVKVANAAIMLGMNVIGYDPEITVRNAWELSSNVQHVVLLEELLRNSDFVSIHVPLLENTKNLINEQTLSLMKPNAILLNFAREGIVNLEALKIMLQEKKLSYYVTDFPTAILKDHPQVIGLPHLGASTKEAEENCAMMIVKQVRQFLEKGTISHSVNFPSIEMSFLTKSFRLAIANLNVPKMVAQISVKLGESGLNIVSLLNKSRDHIAYTLIDVDKEVASNLIKEIAGIEGVLQVRQVSS